MKDLILDVISDMVTNFVACDRKDDEDLSIKMLEGAFNTGQITIDECVAQFKISLEDKVTIDKDSAGYIKYLNTYGGKKLLEKHTLEEEGTWGVLGADHQPYLGIFSGKLKTVIKQAVTLESFWCWGRPAGDIVKIEIKKV